MKCQDFETVAIDLAREPSAAAHGDALAHAEGCERCAARLAGERALEADLRALSAATATSPSAKAEASALAAFRALEPAAAEVVELAPRRRSRVWIPAAAAAAAAFVVVGAVALHAVRTLESAPVAPSAVTDVDDAIPSHSGDVPDTVAQFTPPRSNKPTVTVPGSRDVTSGNRFHRSPALGPNGAGRDDASREVVTDYYPLVGASDLAPADGGQIVRLELPRSALAPFGFQMNAEHSDRPITADVLLGNDGVARAIRFVQTSSSDGRR